MTMELQAQPTSETVAAKAPDNRLDAPPRSSAPAQRERGERPCVVLFGGHAFLLLVSYYILKTLREPLLLEYGSAEQKSYAYATIALALLVLVPAYSMVYRRITDHRRLVCCLTLFFAANITVFYVAGRFGLDISFAYYVWVGIFGVTMLAQFWGYAADVFSLASGRRVFPAIAIGAALGGLIGPPIVGRAFAVVGPWPLLIVAAVLLLLTLPVLTTACARVPEACRNQHRHDPPDVQAHRVLGGLSLVLRDRYLLLIAGFVVLLNCINTTGDYLLADLVVQRAESQLILNETLSRAELIAAFYGNFYLAVNAVTCLAQVFLAARLLRWIGVSGALLVLPIIAVIGYGMLLFVPIFGVVWLFKTIDNATDYSITSTSRHALYLPMSAAAKYEGKIAIDTFYCRIGDLLQAGIVFAGLNWLGFGFREFLLINVALAITWSGLAATLARYCRDSTLGGFPAPSTVSARSRSAFAVRRGLTAALVMITVTLLVSATPKTASVEGYPSAVRDAHPPLVVASSSDAGAAVSGDAETE
jgi:ATP:ADP antiporter, AAA family